MSEKENRMLTSYRPGRVTKFKPSYCKAVIQHLQSGNSIASFCFKIGVNKSTFDKWLQRLPEFAEAVEIALLGSMSEWEKVALDQAKGENKGSGTTLQYMLNNRFPEYYSNKQEIKHTGDVVFDIQTGIKRPGDEGFEDIEISDFREVRADEVKELPPSTEKDDDGELL